MGSETVQHDWLDFLYWPLNRKRLPNLRLLIRCLAFGLPAVVQHYMLKSVFRDDDISERSRRVQSICGAERRATRLVVSCTMCPSSSHHCRPRRWMQVHGQRSR